MTDIEEEEVKPNYPCNKNPQYLPLIDMKGKYKCFICNDNNGLGCTHPIYARRGDKIFDYSRKPLIAKSRQLMCLGRVL